MLTVYGRKSSANVQKVRWICSEGNLEFKTEIVGGKYGGLTSPEFIRLNPNSTIPVLKDSDFILYESNSIIKYISDKFDILRSDSQEKIALNNQWIDWSSSVFGLNCSHYTLHNILLPIDQRNTTLAIEAKRKIYSCFELLNKQLEKTNYLLDNELSLADIPVGCWIHRCVVLGLEITEFKSLEKLYVNLKERSAFRTEVFDTPLPPE
ncbi:glutathione S-transferase [Paracoccaceae bacterium]|nr:glutathione S-transferase [Paracoccaceae bacterium]